MRPDLEHGPPSSDWHPAQLARLQQFGVPRCVDIHCHCLPGLDDGPATMDDALDLCRALVHDGITTVIATPHQLGNYDHTNRAPAVRKAVDALSAALDYHGIPLDIVPGGDVRIDERLTKLLATDEVLTTADTGRHLLLELPHELFVDPLPMIEALQPLGIQAIITHPERHRYLDGPHDRHRRWLAAGAVLQVTAGSLVGEFGQRSYTSAWNLVDAGLVRLVATDAHDAARRPPRMTAALDALTQELDATTATQLCLLNPLRVLEGEDVE